MNFAGPNRRGGMPRKYTLTPEGQELILRLYDSCNRQRIAKRLGVPPWVVSCWACELGVARTKEPPWTPEHVEILCERAFKQSWVSIAKRLGRTRPAVILKAKRLGLRRSTTEGYTKHRLALALGVDDHAVKRWIDRGWLRAKRIASDRKPVQGGFAYYISDEALRDFVIAHPEEIDLRRVDKHWFIWLLAGDGPAQHGAVA